ncbi:MAG: hypothetical protein IT454_18985 [Planctomycetes bacterium]|nr:hypothetical protein [Planctomycetota bacterium]
MAESLPPLTLAALLQALANPSFTAYAYIGGEKDRGWSIAKAAEKMIPNVRVYRIAPSEASAARSEFGASPSIVGIVFGFGLDVTDKLNAKAAEDALRVFNAIWDSDN